MLIDIAQGLEGEQQAAGGGGVESCCAAELTQSELRSLCQGVEEGGKASVRMLLPVALLILPALFVVVLVPAAAELTRLGG